MKPIAASRMRMMVPNAPPIPPAKLELSFCFSFTVGSLTENWNTN